MMTERDLQDGRLRRFLSAVDQEIARGVKAGGCAHCGGTLHSALYPRMVAGSMSATDPMDTRRHSFCCDTCRRRTTPASVRFFGRRRHSAVVMVLVSAMQGGLPAKDLIALREALGVARRTLARWRKWWKTEFLQTRLWQAERGRFMPPLPDDFLPHSLLMRFAADDATTRLILLLRFLLPLSGPGMFTHGAGHNMPAENVPAMRRPAAAMG